jgi:hypothetical protein
MTTILYDESDTGPRYTVYGDPPFAIGARVRVHGVPGTIIYARGFVSSGRSAEYADWSWNPYILIKLDDGKWVTSYLHDDGRWVGVQPTDIEIITPTTPSDPS